MNINNIYTRGERTEYINVNINPIDVLKELIKKTGCRNYGHRDFRYFVEGEKLLVQTDDSYHGSSFWSEACVVSEDKDMVELFLHLKATIELLEKISE